MWVNYEVGGEATSLPRPILHKTSKLPRQLPRHVTDNRQSVLRLQALLHFSHFFLHDVETLGGASQKLRTNFLKLFCAFDELLGFGIIVCHDALAEEPEHNILPLKLFKANLLILTRAISRQGKLWRLLH